MPEEINRIVTDRLADLLFTPSRDGDENLAREGISKDRIRLVGNVMIDTLVALWPAARERWREQWRSAIGEQRFALVTLHRPSNVDDARKLAGIVDAISDIAREAPVLFPIHPRTRRMLPRTGAAIPPGLRLIDPLGYLDFLALQMHATLVITDSGGVQEETTYLQVPCITLRANTERPITVTLGTNILVGSDLELLRTEARNALEGRAKRGTIPPLWDGKAGERIAAELVTR
jgi:UDP-N-acetylglucosamine 2-epimerase (non-hydrolysing)